MTSFSWWSPGLLVHQVRPGSAGSLWAKEHTRRWIGGEVSVTRCQPTAKLSFVKLHNPSPSPHLHIFKSNLSAVQDKNWDITGSVQRTRDSSEFLAGSTGIFFFLLWSRYNKTLWMVYLTAKKGENKFNVGVYIHCKRDLFFCLCWRFTLTFCLKPLLQDQ